MSLSKIKLANKKWKHEQRRKQVIKLHKHETKESKEHRIEKQTKINHRKMAGEHTRKVKMVAVND